jgi:hypothetical protein
VGIGELEDAVANLLAKKGIGVEAVSNQPQGTATAPPQA